MVKSLYAGNTNNIKKEGGTEHELPCKQEHRMHRKTVCPSL